MISDGEFRRIFRGSFEKCQVGDLAKVNRVADKARTYYKHATSKFLLRVYDDGMTNAQLVRGKRTTGQIDVKVAASRGVPTSLRAALSEDPDFDTSFAVSKGTLARGRKLSRVKRVAADANEFVASATVRFLERVLKRGMQQTVLNERTKLSVDDALFAVKVTSRTEM